MKVSKILLAIGMIILPSFPAFSADGIFDGEVGVLGKKRCYDAVKCKNNDDLLNKPNYLNDFVDVVCR